MAAQNSTISFTQYNSGSGLAANGTVYMTISGATTGEGSESVAQIVVRTAGTMQNLYMRVSANTVTATSTTRSRVNAANGNQVASITSSTTGEFQDTTNTDSITAGNKVNTNLVIGATGSTISPATMSMMYVANTNTLGIYGVDGDLNFSTTTASNSYYLNLSGIGNAGTAETNVQYICRTAGTLQNGEASVSTNSRSTATALNSRVATANGNISVSCTANTTGFFEDTTHTDSVTSGQKIDMVWVTGTGTGTFSANGNKVEFLTTNNSFPIVGGSDGGTTTMSTGTTNWGPVGGSTHYYTATESQVQVETRLAGSVTHFQCQVVTNTIAATSTGNFRIGSANGNNILSIGSSTTGLIEDTTHSDTLTATSEINHQFVIGTSTSHSLVIQAVGSLFAVSSSTLLPSVTDSTAVSDTPTLELFSFINKTETTAVSDTPIIEEVDFINVSDSTAVSDSPTLEEFSYINVTDSTAVSDTPIFTGQSYINVTDSSAVTDTPVIEIVSLVSVTDSTAVSDTVSTQTVNQISVYDFFGVSDNTGYALFYRTQPTSSAPLVTVTNNAALQSFTAGTVEAWINVNAAPVSNAQVLSFLGGTHGYQLIYTSGGKLAGSWGNGTTATNATSATSVPTSQWVHVATSWDGTTIRVFINGVLDANTTALSGGGTGNPALNLTMGNLNATTHALPGVLKEVRVSNIARYTSTFTPPTSEFTTDANTAGLWHFDDGSGTTASDSSGNNLTGTLSGTPSPQWVVSSAPITPLNGAIEEISFVNVTDTTAVSDTPTIEVFSYISVTDSSAVSDTPTLELFSYISVTDSSAVSDTPIIEEIDLIAVTDSTAVSDTPTLELISYVNVTDSTAVTDTPTIFVPVLTFSVTDTTTMLDVPQFVEELDFFFVQDSTAVSDTPTLTVSGPQVVVSDSTAVSDVPTIEIISFINVSDTTAVSDSPTTEVYSFINVTDSSAVSDSPTLEIVGAINVTDTTSVSDTFIPEVSSFINVTDTSAVADTPTIFLPYYTISVSDTTAVSDTPQINEALAIAVSDYMIGNIAGYWTFDNISGSNALDSSGYGNTGALSGNYAITAGQIGNAFSTGTDSSGKMTVQGSSSLNIVNQVTLSFWIKSTTGSGYPSIIRYENSGTTQGWEVNESNGTALIYIRVDTSGGGNQSLGFITALDGNWHHIVYTLDTGNYFAYKDGKLSGSGTYSHGTGFPTSEQFLLNGGAAAPANLLLDDVRVYAGNIGLGAVAYLYAQGLLGIAAANLTDLPTLEVVDSIAVTDSTAVSDTPKLELFSYPSVTDTTPVTDTSIISVPTVPLTVSDTTPVSDTPIIEEVLLIAVTDSSAVSDTPILSVVSTLTVTDTTAVSDVPTIELISLVSVTDTSPVSDTPIIFLPTLTFSVSDTTTILDVPQFVEELSFFFVQDSTAVSDTPTIRVSAPQVQVSDTTAVSDSVALEIISFVNVTDTSAVSDTPKLEVFGYINVTDSTAVSDTPKLEIISFISVTDTTPVSDSDVMSLTSYILTQDATAVTDTPSIFVPFEGISVTDATAITDTPILEIISFINVTDTTTVLDIPFVNSFSTFKVSDTTAVSDTPNLHVGINLVVTDTTAVTDSPRIRAFTPFIKKTYGIQLGWQFPAYPLRRRRIKQ